ncbi:MAG TPA: glycosyltransferase family 4 protein [Alicyclobacillus sp.]|nr:glycosyltransferase family 4 protein [Alicyclobacillus sp.]
MGHLGSDCLRTSNSIGLGVILQVPLHRSSSNNLTGGSFFRHLYYALLGRPCKQKVSGLLAPAGDRRRSLVVETNEPWSHFRRAGPLEALACGKPVVASRVGGFAEIGEGLPGVRLVPPDDPVTLAAAVDGMVREHLENPHPEEVARMYSLERMVTRTERVYTEILAKMSP